MDAVPVADNVPLFNVMGTAVVTVTPLIFKAPPATLTTRDRLSFMKRP
jgi:hypothetical protein